jgi:thiol:disulfide interchange protein DsbG
MKLAHFAFSIALASAFGLPGCSKPDVPATLAQPYETIAAQAKGFTVGALMSAQTVYVLFDPQCPHCGHLWEASAPLQNRAKFVWIPVSIINAKSGLQGAALLSASNPVEAMTAHEKSILAGTGGMSTPASVPREMELAIQKNTALFNSLGAESVPYILARNAKTGLVVSNTGALDTLTLAAFLGIAPP